MNPQIGQTISPEQLQSLKGGTVSAQNTAISSPYSPTSPNITPATVPIGQTIPAGQVDVLKNTPSTPAPTSGFHPMQESSDIEAAGLNTIGKGFKQTFNSNGNLGEEVKGALSMTGGLGEAAFSPVSGTLSAVSKLPVLKQASDFVNKYIVNQAATDINNTPVIGPALQKFMAKYPDADEIISNIINTVQLATLFAGGGKVNKKLNEVPPEQLAPDITAPIEAPPTPPVRTPEETAQLQSVADDWEKPTTINKASYNKARAILDKSPETPQFLAENGLDPFTHIEDGKYVTETTAQGLRDSAGKLSADGLRPSLQLADYTTPKVAIGDLPTPDIKTTDFNVTPDDAEFIQNKINSKLDALERKYPEGMTLTNMLDEKITFDKNGGYNPIKAASDNNSAIANRAIANSLRQALIDNVPDDIPIKEFNAELSKYYRAADYLDSLNGKAAPVSFGQQVARYAAKFGMAKLGGLIGGDVISEFAGYQIGKALETFVENLTNPMRDSFLRNLKITNPEAFTKVSEFISNEEAARAGRALLPSGMTNGVPNIINAEAPEGESSVKSVPAKKLPPSVDPKTGKFKTTYSSSP